MPPDKEAEPKEDDLVVQIIEDDQIDLFDDAPAEKAAAPEKPKKAAKKADSDDTVAVLKQRYEATIEAERQKTLAAEKRASEREAELEVSRKRQTEAEGDVISNAKAAAQSHLKQLKADLAKAHNDGEYEKLGDIHEALARTASVLLRLDNDEADYKERREAPPAEKADKKADTPVAPKTPTNVDEWLAEAKLPERAKKFFRDHPEFAPIGKSKAKWHMLMATHEEAVEEGIQFDTGDYYNFLTKRLIDDEDDDVADDTESDDKRVPAAPVSRGAPTRGANGGNVVKAHRRHVEAAEFLGIPIKKYMENRAKLIAEGVMNEND